MHFSKKYSNFLIPVFFLVIGLTIFSPVFDFQFLSDDWDLIYHADQYPSFASRFWLNDHGTQEGFSYRPLVGVYLAVLKNIFGLDPRGYHMFFVLVHSMNAVLVFFWVQRIVKDDRGTIQDDRGLRDTIVPFFAALLFLLLPAHAEAVFWIAAGADPVATFFILLTLLCFDYFLLGDKENRRERRKCYIFSLFFSLLALLTKEIAIALIPGLFFLAWFHHEPQNNQSASKKDGRLFLRRLVSSLIPFLLLGIVFLLLRFHATHTFLGYYGSQKIGFDFRNWISMAANIVSSFFAWGRSRLVLSQFLFEHFPWLIVGVDLLFIFLFRFARVNFKPLALFSALFLVFLLPVLPLNFNQLSDEGERYGYTPSVFFISAFVFVVFLLVEYFFQKPKTQNSKLKILIFAIVNISIICYPLYGLHTKMNLWQRYQDSNIRILKQLHAIREPGKTLLVVGLPDSYFGVHAFRNGIGEAYELLYRKPIDLVRVPVYTVDGGRINSKLKTQHASSAVRRRGGNSKFWYQSSTDEYSLKDGFYEMIPNQIFLKTKDRSLRLTGIRDYEDEWMRVQFFRWHRDSFRSDGATVILKEKVTSRVRDGTPLQVIVFDGEKFVSAYP